MDINEIARIIHQVKKGCLYTNGNSFELEYKTINWEESYILQKIFFMYRWKLLNPCSSYYKEEMHECESILKKLPKGISYTTKTVLENDELQSVEAHKNGYAHKRYKTIYTIQISEAYSRNIFESLTHSRVFIDSIISAETEAKAYDFKQKVLSKYPNVVTDMCLALKNGSDHICASGFGKYEYSERTIIKIEFSNYKLKPLSEEYQYLGLALTIAEQEVAFLKATELFRIVVYSSDARIYKIDITPKDNIDELHEW